MEKINLRKITLCVGTYIDKSSALSASFSVNIHLYTLIFIAHIIKSNVNKYKSLLNFFSLCHIKIYKISTIQHCGIFIYVLHYMKHASLVRAHTQRLVICDKIVLKYYARIYRKIARAQMYLFMMYICII